MATDGLYQLYSTQFSTLLEMKLQQMGSLLRGKVREQYHVGKMASPINQIAAIQLRAPAGRFAPLQRTDNDYTRRWCFPQDGEMAQMVDSFDELKTIVTNPTGEQAESASAAVGRAWDDCLIANALGTAQTGQDAANLTSEVWSSVKTPYLVANTFGAGATSVGLTVTKIIEARRIFRHYHNDLSRDPVTVVIGSTQEADLLRQVEVVSTEFNDKPVLVDGELRKFLGFNMVVSERLAVSSNVRNTFAFTRSGLHLGVWKDMTNIVSQRNDLSGHPQQIYTMASFGATRTQLGKMIEIDCADTVGADITP